MSYVLCKRTAENDNVIDVYVVICTACRELNGCITRRTRTMFVRQDSGFWRVYILILQSEIGDTVREIGDTDLKIWVKR